MDKDIQASMTPAERDTALGDLFIGLTHATPRGAEVDISDPARIVVTKDYASRTEPQVGLLS